jgi:hypothetical protein
MTPREELEALRRLAELEAKAAGSSAPAEKPESQLKSALRTARNVLGPTIEAVPAALGGIAGTAFGPVGTLAGAGLGYGAGRQFTRLMDVALGNEPAPTATQAMLGGAKDVLEGATMEAGGQVIGRGVQAGLQKLSQVPQTRAAKILRDALGASNVPAARDALRAQANLPAGQALADINAPAAQALAERTAARDPAFMNALTLTQKMADMNALAQLAGGPNQAAARATQEQALKNWNQLTGFERESILRRANLGQGVRLYQQGAAEAGEEAARAVQDVRRFSQAAQRAPQTAPPFPPANFRLGERAEDVASAAAQRSLEAGARRRAFEGAERALTQTGRIRPLTTSSIVEGIENIKSAPSLTGNKPAEQVLSRVVDDIEKASKEGVIDAFRLAAIRSNSVRSAIDDLLASADPKRKQEIAASVLSDVKPLIDDAIDKAAGGGEVWSKYLKAYTKGRQAIEQKKLAARAMELYEKDPQELIRLVNRNSLEEVEKIFGRGSYDIVKQMSDSAMGVLKQAAGTLERTAKMQAQASSGQEALRLVFDQNRSRIRVPWGLSAKGAAINQALAKAEDRIGEKTMRILTEAMKSGQRADDLLAVLNPAERARVVKVLREVEIVPKGAKGAAINALLGETESQNALAE